MNNPKEDQSTKDFKDLVDESINIWNLDNVSAVNRVRGLKLDIMIDLILNKPLFHLYYNLTK